MAAAWLFAVFIELAQLQFGTLHTVVGPFGDGLGG